ncbi:MAG: hypothetical protein GVY13_03640 [Alphaproteobacteria bacterium]|jgi:Uma2 family endonuclease|nr:hypothetical protein [Alphaproteobacteria bacterium]
MADAALKPMTVEEFFDWCPDDDRHWELYDGQPMAMAPTSRAHRLIAGNLVAAIHRALQSRPGCAVEPTGGIIPPNRENSWYEPDLVVSCAPVDQGQRYTPEPILIVEILSPSTAREDRRVKLPDYRRIPSVQEVLLVDQERPWIEVHRRIGEDSWSVERLDGMAASLRLTSIPLAIDLATVYANAPLPQRPGPEVS